MLGNNLRFVTTYSIIGTEIDSTLHGKVCCTPTDKAYEPLRVRMTCDHSTGNYISCCLGKHKSNPSQITFKKHLLRYIDNSQRLVADTIDPYLYLIP
jgi:hypothetical protein